MGEFNNLDEGLVMGLASIFTGLGVKVQGQNLGDHSSNQKLRKHATFLMGSGFWAASSPVILAAALGVITLAYARGILAHDNYQTKKRLIAEGKITAPDKQAPFFRR